MLYGATIGARAEGTSFGLENGLREREKRHIKALSFRQKTVNTRLDSTELSCKVAFTRLIAPQ
jgi:hypothetical protein